MNAVNLIPVERRYTGVTAPGAPFLGLLAALVLALAGAVAYVGARDEVSTRQSELAHVKAGAAEWAAAASRYAPAVSAARSRAKGFVRLGILLGQRYEWSVLLGQLAGVMPAHAELSSLGAATPAASAGTAAGGIAASGATTTTSSGITISGCATSQSVVADTMVALRKLSGVSEVSLSSSGRSAAAGSAGSSNCRLPVQYGLTLEFAPAATTVKLLGGAPSTSGGSVATTGAQTAATSDNSTGAAQ